MTWAPNFVGLERVSVRLRRWGVELLSRDKLLARLMMGGGAAFLIYMIGHGLAFITQLILARGLGAENYGIYAYVFAWLTVLAYVATLGHTVAILRFIPTYMASESWSLLAGVMRYVELTTMAAALLLIVIGAAVVLSLGSIDMGNVRTTFLIGLPVVLLWSLVWLYSSMIRAFGGIATALIPVRIVREGALCAFAVGLIFGVPWLPGANLAMGGLVLASLLALAMAIRLLRNCRPVAPAAASPVYDAATWNRTSLPLLVIVAAEALFDKAPVLVLGAIGNSQDAGIFALVFSISMLVVLPRTALDTMFAPAIARLHAERKLDDLRVLVVRAAVLSSASAVAVSIVLVVASRPLLHWFGPEFEAGVEALQVLLVGQLIVTVSGSQLLMMSMTGNESEAARTLLGCTIANLLLCGLLAAGFGLLGAAFASAAMIVVWNVKMAVDIKRKLDLWPGLFAGLGSTTQS